MRTTSIFVSMAYPTSGIASGGRGCWPTTDYYPSVECYPTYRGVGGGGPCATVLTV